MFLVTPSDCSLSSNSFQEKSNFKLLQYSFCETLPMFFNRLKSYFEFSTTKPPKGGKGGNYKTLGRLKKPTQQYSSECDTGLLLGLL